MSNELKSNQTTTVTVRVSKDLRDAYDAAAETRGESRSELLRGHMKRVAGHTTDEIEPPSEELLAKGWKAIQKSADAEGQIPTEIAKSRVSEATRVSKQDSIRCVIRPLDRRGYLIPTGYGTLEILQ